MRTVGIVNIAHDFNFEVCLCGGCLNIRGLPLVIPQEYFSQHVTCEVNVVGAKEPSRFGVLQTHNTGAGNDILVVFIKPASEKSDSEFVSARAGVDLVKGCKLFG